MALKTNSKQVNNKVDFYLYNALFDMMAEYEGSEILKKSDSVIDAFWQIVNDEKQYIKYDSDMQMLEDWLQGLGGFGHNIYYNDCWKLLGEWLEETEEESYSYDRCKVERVLFTLVWRGLERIKKRGLIIPVQNGSFRGYGIHNFINEYERHHRDYMFSAETCRYWGSPISQMEVVGQTILLDYSGTAHECYILKMHYHKTPLKGINYKYFDVNTFDEVFRK